MAIDSPTDRVYGRSDCSIDDKGRIVVPQRFREKLGAEFVLMQGPSNSIRAYPIPLWKEIEALVSSRTVLDEYDHSTQMMQRLFGSSEFVKFDAQSRVTIPRSLKEWADMSDQEMNTVVATGSHIEFWKKSTLAAIQKEYSDAVISNAMAQLAGQVAAENTDTAPQQG
jgi:MraZ protein